MPFLALILPSRRTWILQLMSMQMLALTHEGTVQCTRTPFHAHGSLSMHLHSSKKQDIITWFSPYRKDKQNRPSRGSGHVPRTYLFLTWGPISRITTWSWSALVRILKPLSTMMWLCLNVAISSEVAFIQIFACIRLYWYEYTSCHVLSGVAHTSTNTLYVLLYFTCAFQAPSLGSQAAEMRCMHIDIIKSISSPFHSLHAENSR